MGLASSTCHERVRRLSESGAFQGFHARVHPATAGIGLQAMVAVRLYRHAGEIVDDFEQFAISLPEVVSTYHLTGADDFLLHLVVRDDAHLRKVVVNAFADRAEVDRIETSLIFNHRVDPQWPIYTVPEE